MSFTHIEMMCFHIQNIVYVHANGSIKESNHRTLGHGDGVVVLLVELKRGVGGRT